MLILMKTFMTMGVVMMMMMTTTMVLMMVMMVMMMMIQSTFSCADVLDHLSIILDI